MKETKVSILKKKCRLEKLLCVACCVCVQFSLLIELLELSNQNPSTFDSLFEPYKIKITYK